MGTQRSAAPFEDRHNLAAMRYIASAPTVNLGSDVRVNYWTQPFSGTVWGQYQTDIQKLKYPGDGKGFSRNDFTSLQSELFTEIDWLIKAKDFLTGTGGLSQPFTEDGLKNWAELKDIANTIKHGVLPPRKASAFLEAFLGVVGDIFDIASLGVGEAFAPAFELMGSTLAAGSDIASYGESGESANDRYTTTVDNYGAEFTARMTDIQSAYRRLFDIAVSDWAKLCIIGTRQRCDPQSGGPSGPQLWQFTQDDQDQASLGLQQWSRRDIWRALLPPPRVPLCRPVLGDEGPELIPLEPGLDLLAAQSLVWEFSVRGPARLRSGETVLGDDGDRQWLRPLDDRKRRHAPRGVRHQSAMATARPGRRPVQGRPGVPPQPLPLPGLAWLPRLPQYGGEPQPQPICQLARL